MAQAPTRMTATVKQVLSADSIVLRGQPKGGPPPERNLGLSGIVAPRLGRRGDSASESKKDEPFAFEAREFVRKMLVGKQVTFVVEYKVPKTSREYGTIWVGKEGDAVNVKEELVKEGLVEVRRTGMKANEEQSQLVMLEESAKAAGKGKWAEGSKEEHVRDVKWSLENARQFADRNQGKEIDGIVEFVRDACTMRVLLLPSHQYVTVMLSGVKTPTFKTPADGGSPTAEPFAEEAKYFTESRLLQRNVKVVIEGASNQNVLGTILHPAGNISEFLLREGYGHCVDWSISVVTQGREKLRLAEKFAKEKQLRLWKGFKPPKEAITITDREFTGKVVEVVNADAVVVKLADGRTKKLFLSSLRGPRSVGTSKEEDAGDEGTSERPTRIRPLYDIPYMFEAREFLRKKLIGKKVQVFIDYIKPAENSFPEKTCATVTIGGINVAEALISKGFATVIRHRQDDNQRSSKYDDLLAAESRALKNGRGLHAKKEAPIHRVADLSGDLGKARQFLPFLQRAGRSHGIVEFVASGSRLRIYLPKDTCLATFLLAGISCPKASQVTRGGQQVPSEPYGDEALAFTKGLCLQQEVEVEVDGMDRVGNFIGWLFVDGKNHSLSLVEEGLASVHFSADKSKYGTMLHNAEAGPKSRKEKIWADYEEPKAQEDTVVDDGERKVALSEVVVTEVSGPTSFWAQSVETGPKLEELLEKMREELAADPPLPGAFKPRKGDLCAAQFSDDQLWYRAVVEKVSGSNQIHILYIDFGNREETSLSKLAPLSSTYTSFPAQAKEYFLAFVAATSDEEWVSEATSALQTSVLNSNVKINVEYKVGAQEFVTVTNTEDETDVGKALVAGGLLQVEKRKERRLAKLVDEYLDAQLSAKTARKNVWQYGDISADAATEFGYSKK
ncbi:staphylococcal nuclease domain-containing protein 1-like [Oscarella lobularis]|uniref:staphylococcal nuclease domain-containing protein 1-like n=1 Tax=Oscarella lobularis TaxID=121494 RepID=UPI003313ADB0